jgi:glycosyltransferase involved in cell wall biosynthesis
MLRSLLHSGSDVFHIHSYLYTLSNQAVLAKLVMRTKALLQIHGGVGLPPYKTNWIKIAAKHLYDASLGKFTIEHSDLVASVSHFDLETLAFQFSIPKSRLRYVPNVVDTSVFKPKTKKHSLGRTLLYVGDLELWKGVGSLIEWMRAQNRCDEGNLTMRFVGQGSLFNRLRKLQHEFQKNGRDVRIEVLGPKDHSEIPALMRDADALILPSYWEGMPTVILEAMASGTLAISTRVGDIPSIIEHRGTGFLIDRSLVSFQEAVSTVLFDVESVRRITENARKLVEREFSLDNANLILQSLYSEMVE